MAKDGDMRTLTRSVASGGSSAFFQRIAGRVAILGFQVLLSRSLGVESFGLFAIAQSIFKMAHGLLSTGPMHAIVRFVSSRCERGEWAEAKGRTLDGFALSVGLGGLVVVGLGIALQLGGRQLFGDTDVAFAALGLLICLPAYNALLLFSGLSRALGFVHLGIFAYDLLRPLLVIAVVGCVFLFRASLMNAVLGFVVATYLAVIVAGALVRRRLPSEMRASRAVHDVKGVARYSLLAAVSGIGLIVLSRVDRIMLGVMVGTAAAGVYTAASLAALQVTLGMKSIEAAFAPQIAKLHAAGRTEDLAKLYAVTAKWILTITILLTLPLFLFGRPVLAVFGSGFSAGALALGVLAAGQLLRASIGCSAQLLLMTGHQRLEAINNIILVGANVLLNVLLIPRYAALGAAAATAGSLLLLTGLRFVEIHRVLGLNPFCREMWKPLAAGIAAGAAGYVVTRAGMRLPLELLVGGSVVVLAYVAVLLVLGLDEDYKDLWRMLTRRRGLSED